MAPSGSRHHKRDTAHALEQQVPLPPRAVHPLLDRRTLSYHHHSDLTPTESMVILIRYRYILAFLLLNT